MRSFTIHIARHCLACEQALPSFTAIFDYHATWMRVVLVLRNWLALFCGLEVSTAAEIMRSRAKVGYSVGGRTGPWPIFYLSEVELVAARDNKHLDFRLSVLKETCGGNSSAVVSTICTTHNAFGKLYLVLVIPFHKWSVR